jgi:hypothetical protein
MYKHEHIYVYQFPLTNREGGTILVEYSLCTNISGPQHRDNKNLLESMLRLVYKHMPKGVKFLYEKTA